MLEARKIASESELYEFRNKFEGLSGNSVGIDYLKDGQTRAFYNESGEMVGGFVIKSGPFLRYSTWLPDGSDDRLTFERFIAPDAAEWTCIWLNTRSISRLERALFYIRGFIDCLVTGKKFLIGGSHVASVRRQQMQVFPTVIYRGKFAFDPAKECWLYQATRAQFLLKVLTVLALEPFRIVASKFRLLTRSSRLRLGEYQWKR